jgi:MHS family proline/betaine transporter-like MFS transporter
VNFKTFSITLLGVIVQYYDYHMLALLASIVSKYFFPSADIVVRMFYTYLLITVSYIAKPLGSVIIGKIGDVYGRSATINISLVGTAIASLCISIIPGYNILGNFSIILLLICRMFVAALVSSGTDGIRLFVFEKIKKKNQCLGIGFVTASTMIGTLFASISVNYFTSDHMPDWAWRLTFAIGFLLGIFVFILRRIFISDSINYVSTASNYEQFKDRTAISIIKDNLLLFLLCVILSGTIGSFTQFYIIFLTPFCSDILQIVSSADAGYYRTIAITLYILLAILGGYTTDRLGKIFINRVAGLMLIVVAIFLAILLRYNEFSPLLYLLGASLIPVIIVPAMVILKESVPIVVRYRIFSLAHSIGSIFISAPTSAFSIYLYKYSNLNWLPMIYFIGVVFILVLSVYVLTKIENTCSN